MDSAIIATELEARYHTPSLKLNPDLEKEAQDAMGAIFIALVPYLLPFAENVVSPDDIEWFKVDRAGRFGMSVEDAFTEKDGSPYFAAAKPGFEKCTEVLRAHKLDQGPFILGSEACYADFYLAATTTMFKQTSEKAFAAFMKEAPSELKALHEACQKWTMKQD